MPSLTPSTINSAPTFLSISLVQAVKLSDDNWTAWAENMEMFFIGVGADWVTSGMVPESVEAMDKSLVSYIYAFMEPEQCYRVKELRSATAAWTTLKNAYNKSTMGRRIRACDAIDAILHDPTCPIKIYIQATTAAFQALKDLKESISNTTIGDHLLRHLDPSYFAVRTSILSQETEPDLAKIKATLIGSASSDYAIKTEVGLSARPGGIERFGRGKPSRSEPAVEGFNEGKFTWCDKANSDACHRCGRDGHISRLCARDMPSPIKDLVIQGGKDHLCKKARRAYADVEEQYSDDDNISEDNVHAHTARTAPQGPIHI
ncbi:hypothetical protein C0991_009226 [Blastosporella zonata]|nr:hypothetical protein C0991_009226 [Blastosporella zonata]